jgi:predicted nucleic acid-binding protein
VSYLLDTNVLSELRRKTPDARVVRWFSQRPAGTLYLSVLTLGEIRKGIEMLADQRRRLALMDWLDIELPAFFSGRVLDIDTAVADRWGRIVAHAGRPLPSIDSLLIATAAQHGMTLVSRNLRDVEGLGAPVLSPWQA